MFKCSLYCYFHCSIITTCIHQDVSLHTFKISDKIKQLPKIKYEEQKDTLQMKEEKNVNREVTKAKSRMSIKRAKLEKKKV